MRGRRSFKDPLRILGHGHDIKDFEVETMHRRAVSNSVGAQEGLMIMISKLVEMVRLLSESFSGSLGAEPEPCLRLAGEVREQSQILTKALVSMRVDEQLINRLIRFPFYLERAGDMLENILECFREKALAHSRIGDPARREQQQILALLLDILANLKNAVQNPSKEALLAVLFQSKRLEYMIQEFAGTHWQRVKSGTCPVTASTIWCQVLDSTKWANEYLREMAANLLELGETVVCEVRT